MDESNDIEPPRLGRAAQEAIRTGLGEVSDLKAFIDNFQKSHFLAPLLRLFFKFT